MKSKRRYSGNDKHLGPFTWSRHNDDGWRPLGFVLSSGGEEESHGGCHLQLHGFARTLIVELPQIVKPWRRWVDCSKYEWAKGPNAGYWDQHANEYGFRLSDGFLQVFMGPQTHDSVTTKSWCTHLPWTQWRHIRHSLYDAKGEHFWSDWDRPRRAPLRDNWSVRQTVEKACPAVTFEFDDYDGQRIQAVTRIEERVWKFGVGWFKWLSLFRPDKVRRSLDISFSAEVGPEKGSWKGGTMGHGIDMLPGELHEAAFRRYCEQEQRAKGRRYRITFVGQVARPEPAGDEAKANQVVPA